MGRRKAEQWDCAASRIDFAGIRCEYETYYRVNPWHSLHREAGGRLRRTIAVRCKSGLFFEELHEVIHILDTALRGDLLDGFLGALKQVDPPVDPFLIHIFRQRASALPAEQGGQVALHRRSRDSEKRRSAGQSLRPVWLPQL